MGGNVCFDGTCADRIVVRDHRSRELILDRISLLFNAINQEVEYTSGRPLWHEGGCVEDFIAGSTVQLFDLSIPTDELIAVKNTFGDIDFQFDHRRVDDVKNALRVAWKSGPFTLIDWLESFDTLVTLWRDSFTGLNYQVDLEIMEFKNGGPTDWSRFSRRSDWEDMKLGIKGFAHKYIFRAITAKDLMTANVRMKTKIKHDQNITPVVFSPKGARVKWRSVGVGVWEEIPMEESTLIRDVDGLFEMFFDGPPKPEERRLMDSYVGVVELIKSYIEPKHYQAIVDGMANLLWGKGAQEIVRKAPSEDFRVKASAFYYLVKQLEIYSTDNSDRLISQYYPLED